MPRVFPPPAMREVFGGQDSVVVEAQNVRILIQALDERFPGVKARLVENGAIKAGVAVVVNGRASSLGMLEPLAPEDEVHFLPALGGG